MKGRQRTERPRDPQTTRPADQETSRPGDQQTRRPGDQETRRPADQGTTGPGDHQKKKSTKTKKSTKKIGPPFCGALQRNPTTVKFPAILT